MEIAEPLQIYKGFIFNVEVNPKVITILVANLILLKASMQRSPRY